MKFEDFPSREGSTPLATVSWASTNSWQRWRSWSVALRRREIREWVRKNYVLKPCDINRFNRSIDVYMSLILFGWYDTCFIYCFIVCLEDCVTISINIIFTWYDHPNPPFRILKHLRTSRNHVLFCRGATENHDPTGKGGLIWMGNGSSDSGDSNNEQKRNSLLNSLFEQTDAWDLQSNLCACGWRNRIM